MLLQLHYQQAIHEAGLLVVGKAYTLYSRAVIEWSLALSVASMFLSYLIIELELQSAGPSCAQSNPNTKLMIDIHA